MYKNAFSSSSKPVAPAPVGMPVMVTSNISNLSGFMIPGPGQCLFDIGTGSNVTDCVLGSTF